MATESSVEFTVGTGVPVVLATDYRTALRDGERHAAEVAKLMARPPRWVRSGFRQRDQEYGGHYTRWWVFPPTWSLAKVERELARYSFYIEPTRCTHEYDSCGRWYCDGPSVRRSATRLLVTASWAQNV